MMWTNFKRICKTGFIQFWRNGTVSLSAVLVMIITLFFIATVLLSGALLNSALTTIKDKVDINVYFTTDAAESDILDILEAVQALPEVEVATYTTREEALEQFKARHADDQVKLQSLEILNENPFGAVINIKTIEVSQFEGVATFLDENYPTGRVNSAIEEVNYYNNKLAIDNLNKIIDAGNQLGFIVTIAFFVISIVITFNTIRLAMYISRDEIHVMKLVGARNNYITGPFIVTGAMYGLIAAVFTLILLWPITYYLAPWTLEFFGEDVFSYYLATFTDMFLILFGAGILIGTISSYFAITRYLKHRNKRR